MSDTWTGASSTAWFTGTNWTGLATTTHVHHNGTTTTSTSTVNVSPTISATGTQAVLINGGGSQPVIPATQNEITVIQTVINDATLNGSANNTTYTSLSETQIGGEYITLSNGANLSIQGNALGIFYGTADTLTATGGTLSGLHGATSTIASYDSHMSIIATGTADTLTVEAINENFGLISIGSHDTLTIYNTYGNGANPQALHGLINYGLITVAAGGDLNISAAATNGGTYSNFYNAGWIEVEGGTLSISSSLLDGANTASSAGTPDGYIELGGGSNVILANTVSSTEQVTFTDTTSSNTLQIAAGTLFSGTVNNLGSTNTIIVNGFTSTSNATITTVGGATELITTNGSVLTTITLTGTVSSNFSATTNSSGQEIITIGGNTLGNNTSYATGTNTLTGTGGSLSNNGTVYVTGTGTDVVINSTVAGTGAFFIDYGGTLALDNATGNDAGQTVAFGTHGSAAALNTLLINDNSSGFGGHVTGFGSGDDIVLGGSALPALTSGEGVVLSYSTSSNVLTVSETNASGSVVASSTLTVTGTAALSAGSFIGLESAQGLNIEAAPAAAATYIFSTTGTGSLEGYSNYSGGVAPGDSLNGFMTIAVAAGTASVSSGGVTDNGLISVASGAGFIDAGTLNGTGALTVSGSASLTGNTTLGSITDTGTLTLGGIDAAAVSIGSTGQVTIASGFSDSAAITGAGSLTVKAGVTATLASGSSVASVADLGTLNLAGAMGGSINMQGNGAHTAVDFNTASDAVSLTNFGTTDDIVLGSGALSQAAGNGVVLNYASGVLTVTETNSSGVAVGTDTVTVAGASALTTGAFVALEGANGLNIELAPTAATSFTFSTSGTGSFEGYTNYTGGVAPGDVLSANESVTIAAGTASVSSGGVTDNGAITVASGAGFTDAKSLSGTGSLAVGAGASATLTGATALASITDAGSLTLGGTVSGPVTVTGAAAVTGNLVDSGSLSGSGALSVSGSATLTAGSSVATITDSGSLTVAGAVASNISGTGTLAVASGTSATLSGTDSITTLADAGSLTVSGSFTDSHAINGTGALTVSGSASLTGNTTLGSITDTGTLTLGGTDAAAVSIGATGQVTIASGFSDSAAITGTGSLTVDAGVTATLASGSSIASVLDAGTLDLAGSFGGSIDMDGNHAGTIVDFAGPNVTGGTLNTAITNLGYGDSIVIGTADFALNSSTDALHETYSSTTGLLTVTDQANGSSITVNLGLAGGDPAPYLQVSDASGQLEITLCFYPGTALATPDGEVKVEDVQAGDLVMTANGPQPVRWVGQSHIHTRFADPLRSLPIRIHQGALGDGLPLRDLLLSPDHAICIDGILIQASALVNGSSIVREYNVPTQFTYYHVELDSHELLLAEGTPAESFVDNVDRMHFHNWDERTAPETAIAEMDLPRAKSARQVPQAIRRRVGLNQIAVA